MRFESLLEGNARQRSEKVAVVDGERRLTYGELDALASRCARSLARAGVVRDSRVLLVLENSAEVAIGLFGVLKAAATFSVVNPTTKADKLRYILTDSEAVAVVCGPTSLPAVREAVAGLRSVKVVFVVGEDPGAADPRFRSFEAEIEDAPADVDLERGIDLDLAMIIYTSGSTGVPKGVMMTHNNMVAAATSITTYLENVAEDVILGVLPLSFDYGLYQLLMSVMVGATVVLEKSFAFPAAILERMRAEGVTGLPLVPTMAAMLLQMRDLRPGSLPRLRYITNTGAALPPSHILRLQDQFPGVLVYSMYGVTECKRCTYLPPSELPRRPGSVGKAIPGTEAYVVDEAGRPVGPGTVGELVIRGAHVMQGYWNDEKATAKALRPGRYPWEKVLHTGDLFRADEEGFLYFVGRSDDIIKSRGEKVSPKEVENVLYALPGIKEAAVVGVPDAVLGHSIRAVVVLSEPDGLTARQIRAHCAEHLETFMVPQAVEFRASLPKTESGKIDRRRVEREVLEVAKP